MFILPKIAFHFMSYCVLRARAYLTEIAAVLLACIFSLLNPNVRYLCAAQVQVFKIMNGVRKNEGQKTLRNNS